MPLPLRESRAATEMARVLYDFLPASGGESWKRHVTFPSVAAEAGVGEFWLGGSKEPTLAKLLELTLERRRHCFEPLILGIVREGLKYRQPRPQQRRPPNPVRREEIETLNGLLKEVGFKFPTLWDPGFLASLERDGGVRARQIVEEEKAAERLRATEASEFSLKLDRMRDQFYALSIATDRQKAGLAFEPFLRGLFTLFGLNPRLGYRVEGEQIDGAFELDGEHYLLEAKWEAAKLGQAELLVFRGKIEGKSSFTRGVFIAANGYTDEAVQAITRGKQPSFFLMDGHDLSRVVQGDICLDELLREKRRALAEEGIVYKPRWS